MFMCHFAIPHQCQQSQTSHLNILRPNDHPDCSHCTSYGLELGLISESTTGTQLSGILCLLLHGTEQDFNFIDASSPNLRPFILSLNLYSTPQFTAASR